MTDAINDDIDQTTEWSLPLRRRTETRLVIVGICALVLVPVLYHFVPQEAARWYLAAAEDALLDKRTSAALNFANTAVQWSADNEILLARARLQRNAAGVEKKREQVGRCREFLRGSLRDYDQLIAAREKADPLSIQARRERSIVYQRLGRHHEAVADQDLIVDHYRQKWELLRDEVSGQLYGVALNDSAYARALGRLEVSKALKDIAVAFEAVGREDDHAMLDTRGYLFYLDGQFESALQDMEAAAQLSQLNYDRTAKFLKRRMDLVVDQRPLERDLATLGQHMSVIYYHRGLVYQALGKDEAAAEDLSRADELGYRHTEGEW